MSEPRFKTWEEFFDRVGEDFLHPKQWGESLWPVSVEEMYQHFRARLLAEVFEHASKHGHEAVEEALNRLVHPRPENQENSGE